MSKKNNVGQDQYKTATDEVVSKLNDEAKKNVRSWLVMGEAVAVYIEATKQAPGDAFKRLAGHKDIHLGANALRAYYSAWKLWKEVGKDGVPPVVDYTAFVVVASSSSINYQNRLNLLQDAEKNGWSISELKEQIRLLRQGAKPAKISPEGEKGGDNKMTAAAADWKQVCKSLEGQSGRLIEDLNLMGSLGQRDEASSLLRRNIRNIVQLAIVMGLIDRGYILDNMPGEIQVAA